MSYFAAVRRSKSARAALMSRNCGGTGAAGVVLRVAAEAGLTCVMAGVGAVCGEGGAWVAHPAASARGTSRTYRGNARLVIAPECSADA
jgi:hypothetical protein